MQERWWDDCSDSSNTTNIVQMQKCCEFNGLKLLLDSNIKHTPESHFKPSGCQEVEDIESLTKEQKERIAANQQQGILSRI
jgi:hypothetical protein